MTAVGECLVRLKRREDDDFRYPLPGLPTYPAPDGKSAGVKDLDKQQLDIFAFDRDVTLELRDKIHCQLQISGRIRFWRRHTEVHYRKFIRRDAPSSSIRR